MAITADGFDLMKLAQLRGNLREQLQQYFPPVANNALYCNAFFPQIVQRFGIEGVGFVFDFTDGKDLPADAVHQHHHAETAPEVSGVHDDVGFGRLREGFPDARPAQMAVDGLAATTVLRGELGGSLLARAVGCPKFIALVTPATVKLPATVAAFIALLAVALPVLFDLLRATEKAFFVFKGFDPA